MITGFIVPASRSARTSRPGRAPMYVRRWPRISASSRMPPSDMRTNSRPSAGALVLGDAALGAQLADGQVLDHAVLDVAEAGVVGVEDLARVRGIEALL